MFVIYAGKKIDMTAPVLMKIPEKKIFQQGVFTMSFLLPAEYQNNPPQPTNKDVNFVMKFEYFISDLLLGLINNYKKKKKNF